MVTPSLVMVGAPNDLLMTTLRPFGPSVTLTASARASTPRSRERRAESLNSRVLAMGGDVPFGGGTADGAGTTDAPAAQVVRAAGAVSRVAAGLRQGVLLDDDGEDVTGGED